MLGFLAPTIIFIISSATFSQTASQIIIAEDENTSLDMQVKINLDLLPYIYPKRKSIDMNSNDMPEVKIFINHEEVGVESKEHF